MKEVTCCSETLVSIYKTTRYNDSEDVHLNLFYVFTKEDLFKYIALTYLNTSGSEMFQFKMELCKNAYEVIIYGTLHDWNCHRICLFRGLIEV
jgi:hypothetical protein